MKKVKYLIIGIVGTITLLLILQVSVSNSISTAGIQLGTLQSKIAKLDKSNEKLHEDYLRISAFMHIASEAGKLGFFPSNKDISVSQPSSYAMKP